MGLGASLVYSIVDNKPNMPHLQSLISSGIRFENVWSNPVCSPTRATILTGRYGFKTNVLSSGDVMSTAENLLFDVFNNNAPDYSHAVIGKWHLSHNSIHPNSN